MNEDPNAHAMAAVVTVRTVCDDVKVRSGVVVVVVMSIGLVVLVL